MVGISIYNGMDFSLEENIRYIELAHQYGVRKIFTSFHIPESNKRVYEETEEILNKIKQLGMELIVDISKQYLDKIDINKYDIHALRLDFGFDINEVTKLTKTLPFKVQLNASTVTKCYLENLKKLGADLTNIEVCHNYYPRKDTGLSFELMLERNKVFKEHGMNVMAFVPSRVGKRGPIYEGLPTLECHRNINPLIAVQHLFAGQVDEVLIGDSLASEEELRHMSILKKDIFTLPIKCNQLTLEEKEILEGVHHNRMDSGEFVIRSEEARNKRNGTVLANNTVERKKYYVTIDNAKYLRYEGELQILKKDMVKDARVNVVGDCSDASLLIDMIKPGDAFQFFIEDSKF